MLCCPLDKVNLWEAVFDVIRHLVVEKLIPQPYRATQLSPNRALGGPTLLNFTAERD